jgi:hypothetical protein
MRNGCRRALVLLSTIAGVLACAPPAGAQVTRLEILSREPAPTRPAAEPTPPYEIIHGRVHGEVDPADPHNRIIQDLALAPRNARGRVEYVATFAVAVPVDRTRSSGTLVYRVVNRGNGAPEPDAEGDISLVSGWQGDVVPTAVNQTIQVPVAHQPDGSPITGPVIARFVDLPEGSHTTLIRLSSIGASPQPYPPASLDDPSATLTSYASESPTGVQTGAAVIPREA